MIDLDDNAVNLSFKDLLNVSSDWKEVNNLKGNQDRGFGGEEVDVSDFQAKQIERILDAIEQTLPANAQNTSLGMMIGGNTLSTANLDS